MHHLLRPCIRVELYDLLSLMTSCQVEIVSL